MAKIKEIYVEAKRSWNFQTYTVGITAECSDEESIFKVKELQTQCRKLCQEQIDIDKGKLAVNK
jgi:hypothetical protein